MSSNYPNQVTRELVSSSTLTSSFGDTKKEISVGGMQKLSLDIDYQRGSGELSSKLQMKIEHSTDGVNWYSLVIDETSTVSTVTPRVWEVTDTAKVNILIDIAYDKLRISFAESGVTTNAGTVSANYTVSGK